MEVIHSAIRRSQTDGFPVSKRQRPATHQQPGRGARPSLLVESISKLTSCRAEDLNPPPASRPPYRHQLVTYCLLLLLLELLQLHHHSRKHTVTEHEAGFLSFLFLPCCVQCSLRRRRSDVSVAEQYSKRNVQSTLIDRVQF
jgi:hypothetical protein